MTLPDYIPPEWGDRIYVVQDDRGTHYVWVGWNNGEGHGKVRIAGNVQYTHRFIYERVNGVKLTRFDYVDHKCEHKGCINADHLEAVPPGVNTYRGPGRFNQFRTRDEYASA